MVNMVKAPFDVSLHEPFNPCKILLHILECCMAAPLRAESVGCVQESWLIDALQYHTDNLLYQLIVEGRNTEGTLFAVGLGDICPAGRGRLVAEIFQPGNQRIDTLHAHAIHGLAVRSSGHVALLGLYFLVCGQIKFGIVQIAVKSLILVIVIACFRTKIFQYILGTSHGVSHTFPFMNWGYPAALRHVQGFSLLRLLRRLRCPAGYSGPAAIAITGIPV